MLPGRCHPPVLEPGGAYFSGPAPGPGPDLGLHRPPQSYPGPPCSPLGLSPPNPLLPRPLLSPEQLLCSQQEQCWEGWVPASREQPVRPDPPSTAATPPHQGTDSGALLPIIFSSFSSRFSNLKKIISHFLKSFSIFPKSCPIKYND